MKICHSPADVPMQRVNVPSQAKANSVSNTHIGTPAATQAAAEALAAEARVQGGSSSTLLRDATTASPEDQGPRALTCMLPLSGATASQGVARPACIERRVLATPVMLCAPAGASTELRGGGAELAAQDLPDAVYDRLQVRTGMCRTKVVVAGTVHWWVRRCGVSDGLNRWYWCSWLLRLCLSALGGVRAWQRRSWLEQWEPRAKSRRSPKTSPRGCWYL